MATKKLTFTLPEDLVTQFLRRIPPNSRSRYVASALEAKLQEHEEQLIRACEVANRSADVLDIEKSFDGLADDADRVQEPW